MATTKNSLDMAYQLLDFGSGRKLERFGEQFVDRPSLAAASYQRSTSEFWNNATGRFMNSRAGERSPGEWHWASGRVERWHLPLGKLTLLLKPTAVGHIGFFPEHCQHWDWLSQVITPGQSILNLFGYTGATTLRLSQLGARVTHVDSSKSAVNWARENARRSGLEDRPLRWIVEDAQTFVSREIKRGKRYDGFVADPPSYGHGPAGQTWKIDDGLELVLNRLRELTGPRPQLALLTSHSATFRQQELQSVLSNNFPSADNLESGEMRLPCQFGKSLAAGWYSRLNS